MQRMQVDDSNTAIISVAELNRRAREFIEAGLPLLWVAGEISNFTRAASGHCYFSLKDATAQVRCVFFRHKAALIDWKPENGMQVEVRALPTLYEARGDFQLTVENMRRSGLGALFEAFERLKRKLEQEGLFDPSRRRPIPEFPRSVGVVTSPKAAALRDVLTTLARRMPGIRVVLYPTPVQGEGAGERIAQAIRAASARMEIDVLIVCRGGGSMEDLWAFNDEALTRAVAESDLPIVSAVGHETDFTLCDFAADARAPTPTAAAMMVTPERDALVALMGEFAQRASAALRRRLDRLGERVDRTGERLRSSSALIAPWREAVLRLQSRLHLAISAAAPQRLASLTWAQQRLLLAMRRAPRGAAKIQSIERRLTGIMAHLLSSRMARLQGAAQSLALLNPANVLLRGYALVFDRDGIPVTDALAVAANDALRIRLKSGEIQATVTRNVSDPG